MGRLIVASALVLLIAIAGCAGGERAGEPHVLVIADIADPSSLNPLLAHDQDTIAYDLLVCQTLVGLDARNRLVPVLVTRIPSRANGDISADGKTIVYRLRRNVRFADGTPLRSTDVAFTYRAILDDRNNVLSQDNYRRIASLQTPDAHTVVIHLKRRWNAAVKTLFAQADFAFGILPAHAFTSTDVMHAPWGEHPFGTGPFYVVDWRRGDRVILARNPYYLPKPKLQRIVLRMIPDEASIGVALRTHEVDVGPAGVAEIAELRSTPGLRIVATPENATGFLELQTKTAPTNDVRVRRAIADALDPAMLRKAYRGLYASAGSFLPPVLTGFHDAAIPGLTHEVKRAGALLDAAGWRMHGGIRMKNGVALTGVIATFAGTDVDRDLATVAQEELARVGMRFSVKTYSYALFNAPSGPVRNGRFNIAIDGWLGGADPEQSIVFRCSQANVDGDNISRFCDPRFEALFADQATTSSEARRRADFTAMQRLIYRQRPAIPIFYRSYFEAVSTRVKNWRRNMLDFPVNAAKWDVQ